MAYKCAHVANQDDISHCRLMPFDKVDGGLSTLHYKVTGKP